MLAGKHRMNFTEMKSLDQLAYEGRTVWKNMMTALKEGNKEQVHEWNRIYCQINTMIRDGFYC